MPGRFGLHADRPQHERPVRVPGVLAAGHKAPPYRSRRATVPFTVPAAGHKAPPYRSREAALPSTVPAAGHKAPPYRPREAAIPRNP